MVHLSWPLRAYMSGDGYLSGGVAAGLLHLLGTRGISESRAWLPLRLALRQPPVWHLIASCPCFPPARPLPFSRLSLLSFHSLLDSPPPPASLRSHLRSQPGIISFAKTPRGLFGRAWQEGFFLEGTAAGSRLPLCLAARHFSPRSRTLGCVVFLLAPRVPMCKRSLQ